MAAQGEPSIKATLRQGVPAQQGASAPTVGGTLVGLAPAPVAPWVDRHPFLYTLFFFGVLVLLAAGIGLATYRLVRG